MASKEYTIFFFLFSRVIVPFQKDLYLNLAWLVSKSRALCVVVEHITHPWVLKIFSSSGLDQRHLQKLWYPPMKYLSQHFRKKHCGKRFTMGKPVTRNFATKRISETSKTNWDCHKIIKIHRDPEARSPNIKMVFLPVISMCKKMLLFLITERLFVNCMSRLHIKQKEW